MFTPRYRVAPLCSGAVLLVVLSACTANPTYEERAATPAPSTSTSYTVPVGQVDEYKAGRPRPSASGGTTPAVPTIYGQDGVGDKSIIPLRPRTPLKAGQKNVP